MNQRVVLSFYFASRILQIVLSNNPRLPNVPKKQGLKLAPKQSDQTIPFNKVDVARSVKAAEAHCLYASSARRTKSYTEMLEHYRVAKALYEGLAHVQEQSGYKSDARAKLVMIQGELAAAHMLSGDFEEAAKHFIDLLEMQEGMQPVHVCQF